MQSVTLCANLKIETLFSTVYLETIFAIFSVSRWPTRKNCVTYFNKYLFLAPIENEMYFQH